MANMNRFVPNSTMIPNAFFDEVMQHLSEKALRTYLIISRKTTGWGKEWDSISISQFMQFTGIKDERTIRSGLNELIKIGLIKPIANVGHATKYALNLDAELPEFKVAPPASDAPPTRNEPPASDAHNPLHEMQGDPLHEMPPTKTTNKTTNTKTKSTTNVVEGISPKKGKKFVKPTLSEVAEYCVSIGSDMEPGKFIDHYESVGWVSGKAKLPIKDWKAAVRGWARREKEYNEQKQKSPTPAATRNPGFKQPTERPDYSSLWGGDFIDSTAKVIANDPV